MKKTEIIISDRSQLIEFSNWFDSYYKCNTFTVMATLSDIWKYFMMSNPLSCRYYANDIGTYNDTMMSPHIQKLFEKKTIRYSNEPDVTGKMIGKLNSVYLIKQDILNGVNFKFPMSVTIQPNYTAPVHPGGTRLMFSDVYQDPVEVIVTDLTASIDKKITNLNFEPISQVKYDFSSQPLMMVFVDTDDRYCSTAFDKALNEDLYDLQGNILPGDRKAVTIKQLVDYNILDYEHSYHRPLTCDPPRKFELKDRTVFVDELPVFELHNQKWRLTMDG